MIAYKIVRVEIDEKTGEELLVSRIAGGNFRRVYRKKGITWAPLSFIFKGRGLLSYGAEYRARRDGFDNSAKYEQLWKVRLLFPMKLPPYRLTADIFDSPIATNPAAMSAIPSFFSTMDREAKKRVGYIRDLSWPMGSVMSAGMILLEKIA